MIDPVAIIKDIAEAAGYKFIYGGSAYANYELTSLGDLTDDSIVVFMFPFIENAEVVSSGIDGFTLDTIISVGRKSEATTYSNLDETEKQKYDRRLKDLKAYLVSFVQSVLCNSDFELNSLRIDSTLNRFNENLDTVNGQLTLRYSNSSTGTGYDITAPLPEQVDWSRISNKPEPITALSGTNTGDQDLSGYAEKITNYSHSIHANESLFPETGSANLIYKSLDSGFLYRWNGSTYYAVGITTPIGTEFYKALAGNSVLNKLFDVDIPTPADGDMLRYNGTTEKYEAVKRVGFSARNSTTSMNAATFTDMVFQIEDEDTHDSFDGTVFTVPENQGGMYEVFGHITFDTINDGNIGIVAIYVNDSASTRYLLGRGANGATTLGGYGAAVRINLNAGDNLRIKAYCQNATNARGTGEVEYGYCTFSAYKMIP